MPRERDIAMETPNVSCDLGWNIHNDARQRFAELDQNIEECYTWVEELLIEIKKAMASPEIQLLPKTPSAKRARKQRQRNANVKIVEESTEDEECPSKKKSRKETNSARAKTCKAETCTTETEDTAESDAGSEILSVRSTRSTRSTRSSRSTKPTSQCSTRPTRGTKNKRSTEVQPPVLVITSAIDHDEEMDTEIAVESNGENENNSANQLKTQENSHYHLSDTRNSDSGASKRNSGTCDDPKISLLPKPSVVHTGSPKPIPGFRLLSVKDKAQAFETLASSSDVSEIDIEPSSCNQSQTERASTDSAPGDNVPIVLNDNETCDPTPDVVPNPVDTSQQDHVFSPENVQVSPEILTSSDEEHTGMHVEEVMPQPPKNKTSPRRSVTKARLSVGYRTSLSKRRSSIMRHKLAIAAKNSSAKKPSEAVARLNESLASIMKAKAANPAKSTRSKLRLNKNPPAALSDDCNDSPQGTQVRSTRSKTRQPKPCESTCTSTPQRSTRSKMHKIQSATDTPDAGSPGSQMGEAPSTMAPARSTRSKMRKRQQELSPDYGQNSGEGSGHTPGNERDGSPPKRPCSPSHWHAFDKEPIHPKSFLSTLKKKVIGSGSSSNLNTTVKSFIQRNTPQKETQSNILDIKRKKLAAKDKKDEDRIHKRQELLLKKTEEQKRRREEKQLMAAKRREDQLKRERDAKRGANQKQEISQSVTARVLEEKMKEEREKHKLREKRLAEAELKRKHEDESRVRKQKDLDEEQRNQEEFMRRKKEYEDKERQKKIAEQRRQHEERQMEVKKEQQKEAERLRVVEEKKREEAELKLREEREKKDKEHRDRLERERVLEKERQQKAELERQKREMERQNLRIKEAEEARRQLQKLGSEEERKVQADPEKHNHALQQNTSMNSASASASAPVTIYSATKSTFTKSVINQSDSGKKLNTTVTVEPKLNTTVTREEPPSESYDMTPVRKVYGASSVDNYNIQDLNSDDSTDDEEAPRKKIPAWATGAQLRSALIVQHYQPPDLDKIFDTILDPDLNLLFTKRKARFNKRTSSAIWNSPIYKPSGKPQDE